MYHKTRFRQLLDGLPQGAFAKLVEKHKTDKYSKGFRSKDQLIAMIYAQLSHCKSLRELEESFNAQTLHHYHLGTRTIKRSTLAEANTKRSCELFADLCGLLIKNENRKLKIELTEMLYLLDSSPINLTGEGFNKWTTSHKNHIYQGLKMHFFIRRKYGDSKLPSSF